MYVIRQGYDVGRGLLCGFYESSVLDRLLA